MIRRIDVLLIFGFLTCQSSVFAQPSQDAGTAEEHNKRAYAAIKRGDRDGARSEFARSYELFAEPKTLWNLLIAETDTNHPVDALKHLRMYLADARAEKRKKEAAKGLMTELLAQTGRLKIRIPEAASVRLDGVGIMLGSDPVDVTPGTHTVEAQFRSGSQRRDVVVRPGEEVPVTFEDDEGPSKAGMAPPSAASGSDLARAEPSPRGAPPPPATVTSGNSTRTWLLVGGGALAGVGLVSVVVGAGFKIDQGHQEDSATDARTRIGSQGCASPTGSACDDYHRALRARNSDAATAPVFFIGGAALLVVGAGAFITGLALPATRKSTEQSIFVPSISPTMVGGSFVSHF